MKTRSGKAKGLRLEKQVAEAIASRFSLRIEAMPGGKIGGLYVGEQGSPDIRVRGSSEPGGDVVLVSKRAQGLSVPFLGVPLGVFECKNQEGWTLDQVWRGTCGVVAKALEQLRKNGPRDKANVVVLSKNRTGPICLVQVAYPMRLERDRLSHSQHMFVYPEAGGIWVVVSLDELCRSLILRDYTIG